MTRVVAQRVRRAAVRVGQRTVGEIEIGLVVLVGIGRGDQEADVERVADKLAVLRIFEDAAGKMNLSAAEVGGAVLAVSQFTLYADTRKGRRPSFISAEEPDRGRALYEHFCSRLRWHEYRVEQGEFGAEMVVDLENDGPVTICLDSEHL